MSKIIFIFVALFAIVFADDHFFVYPNGKLMRGAEEGKIFGRMDVVQGPRHSYVELDGLFQGKGKTPIYFTFTIDASVVSGDQISLTGQCEKTGWDGKNVENLTGSFKLSGTWEQGNFEAICKDPKTSLMYKISLTGTNYDCEVYHAADATNRAHFLNGELSEHFSAVQVLHFAYYDYPYLTIAKMCKYYLNHFGEAVDTPKPGFVIVAKDGTHCGVIDSDGDKFIHSNPVKKEVTVTPLALAKDFFKSGYVFKNVPCKGPHLSDE